MNEYRPNQFEREPKSNGVKYAFLGIIVVSVIIGSIFMLPKFLGEQEISLDEGTTESTVSSGIPEKNPTIQLETVPSDAFLDEEISEYTEYTVDLKESGRYLFSFSPDADVLVYNRLGYPKVKTSSQGDYYFDINNGENTKVTVTVQPRTSTKLMLVQRARFR